jgi:hypothetical protein
MGGGDDALSKAGVLMGGELSSIVLSFLFVMLDSFFSARF